MSDIEKNDLISGLRKSFARLDELVDGIELELLAYSDSNWQIRDILGHIATWDVEAEKSLRAYVDGDEYLTPDLDPDEADFNRREVLAKRSLSETEVYGDWKSAREELIAAVQAIPLDMFPGDLLYPWGDERGSIRQLVEYMIEHDEEHQAEIEVVIGR